MSAAPGERAAATVVRVAKAAHSESGSSFVGFSALPPRKANYRTAVLPFHEKTCLWGCRYLSTRPAARPHKCRKPSGCHARELRAECSSGSAKKRSARRLRHTRAGEHGLPCSMAKIWFNKNRNENAGGVTTGYTDTAFAGSQHRHRLVCLPALYLHICF